MGIEKIGFGRPVSSASEANKLKEKKSERTDKVDRVDLSEEAKMLFESEKAKRINEIRAKVENGFYDSQEVREKVVERLIMDIQDNAGG